MEGASRSVVGIPLPHPFRTLKATGLGGIGGDVEILRNHAGVSAEIGSVAGMVEDDVGVDLDVGLVGVVDEFAQGGAGAITGLPMSSLGSIA